MSWTITAFGHLIIVLVYVWIAVFIGVGLSRSSQWRKNPLGVATFFIFATCAVGHAVHIEHAYLLNVGIEADVGEASRVALADPILVVWTMLTAAAGIWYFSKRRRLEIVHTGAALCDDMTVRQAEALEIQTTVLAATEAALAGLASGQRPTAVAATLEALTDAKRISATLMGKPGDVDAIQPGDLRQ